MPELQPVVLKMRKPDDDSFIVPVLLLMTVGYLWLVSIAILRADKVDIHERERSGQSNSFTEGKNR